MSKEEILSRYEQIIVKTNQMNVYGYDLQEVTFKLKTMTQILLDNKLDKAERLLSEIERNLKVIEAKGPESMHRERRLAWLEVYSDLIQQMAIFIVLGLILLRFSFIKESLMSGAPSWRSIWKIIFAISFVSIFSASFGLIRYGKSAWSFVDLQVIWVGISGLIGGIWVGLIVGLANSLFRLIVIPQFGIYFMLPFFAGLISALFYHLQRRRPMGLVYLLVAGYFVGFLHSICVYIPIYHYLPGWTFLFAIAFLSIIEGGIIFIFFVLSRQMLLEDRRKETERQLFRTRLQFLRAQINPHFLFNTLNTIAAICGEENARRARELIIQLSTLFRRLSKGEGDFVLLKDEFDYIDAYLNIEKARFGDRLQIEKDIRLSENGLATQVPILVLQPIVENAVKHGISRKAEGGILTIKAEEMETNVVIEIRDTGIGMDEATRLTLFQDQEAAPLESEEHAGIALSNIRERMEKLFGDQFEIFVESVPGQGTNVKIIFPRSED